ncbi:MAG: spondin domain-containing protein [Pseudomonadales bacterium]|nr:spondin domain-containing protein [Pseudomonadales bacterium]
MNRKANLTGPSGVYRWSAILGITALTTLLAGCPFDGDSDNNSDTDTFEVTITNLTAGQPFSPAAVIFHGQHWRAFTTGKPASVALETLAEGGDNASLLAEAADASQVYGHASGQGPIAPGASETVTITLPEAHNRDGMSVSVLTMLVNSNDGLAALNGVSLAALEERQSLNFTALSYDSGTEANTETADTIPGPAASGGAQEGFNPVRDDVRDAVALHGGVVTQDDGMTASVLRAQHRWDHPAMRVTIVRTD